MENKSNVILKNTIVLYVRMIINMFIALYTSRVVLSALGVSDFGLYNVVGGVVGLFSFLRTSMASATQRFLSYELGKKDYNKLSDVFSMSLTTHIMISLLIFVLCETIGLWLLNTKINIPEGREVAANWVYQFAVLSLCINMVVVPFNACVISYERMSIFAYISILESVLKLIIAWTLLFSPFDCLIFYALLMMLISIVIFFLYYIVCKMKFTKIKYRFFLDKELLSKIFGFSGWSLLGQLAVICSGQGTSILTNMFHSVTANAAMGVAQQANGAISGLVANFQTAYQPQITKSYAVKDWDYLNKLICNASKISFFLLFLVSLPIIFNIDGLLALWLKNVPIYTSEFFIYFLIASMLNAIGGPLWMSVFASGDIKKYQICSSIIFGGDIILVYCLFEFGLSPIAAVQAKVFTNFIVIFVRLHFAKEKVKEFSILEYLKRVLVPIFSVSFMSVIVAMIVFNYLDSFVGRIIASLICVLTTSTMIYYIALNKNERKLIINVFNKFKK